MGKYDLKSLNLPVLSGTGLKLFAAALRFGPTRALLMGSLLKNGGIPVIRETHFTENPTYYPLKAVTSGGTDGRIPMEKLDDEKGNKTTSMPYASIRDYAEAYRKGKISPIEVAERVLAAIEQSETLRPRLNAFIAIDKETVMAQAKASAERFEKGQPLSIFDGVPVTIKDEVDMMPYPTTGGMKHNRNRTVNQDATVVARLREAGAMLLGKAHMPEIGIIPQGQNVHHGRCCNPWNLDHDTGGSSSGPSAAVAAGFSPVSIGADGGGSIRVPASHCGLVGLKATFGRVSEHGAIPLDWSVAHIGPIGASVEDVALTYAATAGPDPLDELSQSQPPVSLGGWNNPDLKGMKLGVYWDWFRHANAEVVAVNEAMLEKLKDAGAEIVEIEVPELNLMRVAHVVSILTEMVSGVSEYLDEPGHFSDLTQLNLIIGKVLSSSDYVQAQRMRTRSMETFDRIFETVDAVITPACGIPAPHIPESAKATGISDLNQITEVMRFMFPSNFTGNPAISFPAGYTQNNLPVGMQAIGNHWEEHKLLQIAYAAEQVLDRRKPGVFYPVLT